ncbi:MAG: SDR family NAD(P)-dependent oxidoreductase [Novosphingobium sp.]
MSFRERYGPWALIAGASEGTGAAFARQLAAEGLNCILVARREGPLTALADELRGEFGIDCVTASIDLSAPDAVDRLANAAGDREIGLFISNAGADTNGSQFLNTAIGHWDTLVMRNVVMVMRACHRFAGPMRARGRGGIILVGSGACYGGLPGISVYGASKAFDLVLGEALWSELRPHGVDVLNLIMGKTDTPAHRELMERLGVPFPADAADADAVAALGLARLPHGPVQNWGQADDEAGMEDRSAAQRRERIIRIEDVVRQYAKHD